MEKRVIFELVNKLEMRYGNMNSVPHDDKDFVRLRYGIIENERDDLDKQEKINFLVQELKREGGISIKNGKALIRYVLHNS